jgi:hypothetical protein
MAKLRNIILGTVAVVAVGAGLTYSWQQYSEKSIMDDSRTAQAASDSEVTSGPADKLLWGDTHLHTANSIDAFGFGVKLGPEDALRFARGEEVTSTGGMKAQLERPLDFLVIADHSGGLGATKALYDAPGFLVRDPTLKRWHRSGWPQCFASRPDKPGTAEENVDKHLDRAQLARRAV